MRLTAMQKRLGHAQLGIPAAVTGVLAGTLAAAPAGAAVPPDTAAVPSGASLTPLTARPLPATAVPARAEVPTHYTVQSGDTVFGIAERFGLATADVLEWNGLGWRSVIHPGQTITLTSPSGSASARPAAKSAASTHTVVAGDTIFAIAERHGTTVDDVLAANGLTRSSIIYPGQTLALASSKPAAAASDPAPETASAETSSALNAPQAENATLIIRIGRELGVPDRGIAIALGTSMVESWMRNLDWGDHDSAGLFQQRPSTGWGTPAQIMDRGHSIRAFFTGVSGPDGTITRGLLDVPGWESMSFAEAAQAVQISAYPQRYAQWESAAYEWLATYG